jgi:hypothetical protein
LFVAFSQNTDTARAICFFFIEQRHRRVPVFRSEYTPRLYMWNYLLLTDRFWKQICYEQLVLFDYFAIWHAVKKEPAACFCGRK